MILIPGRSSAHEPIPFHPRTQERCPALPGGPAHTNYMIPRPLNIRNSPAGMAALRSPPQPHLSNHS